MKKGTKDLTKAWRWRINTVVPVILTCLFMFILIKFWDVLYARVAMFACIGMMVFCSYITNHTSYLQGSIDALKWVKSLQKKGGQDNGWRVKKSI